jgi:GNAT superfamily N-acetyltransferase
VTDAIRIRRAMAVDLPLLREVEVRAGAIFRDIGMDEIAGDDPGTIGDDAVVWVAEDDEIVGYVLVLEVDGDVHVEQVSVVPEARGRRIGATLIDAADGYGRAIGARRVTLTTFRDVPWNAPYYERIGFEVIEDLGPELAALVEHERDVIPGEAPRVVMARLLE